MSELAPGERQELVRHLKRKWGSLNEAYQKLSLSPDTAPKVRTHLVMWHRQMEWSLLPAMLLRAWLYSLAGLYQHGWSEQHARLC